MGRGPNPIPQRRHALPLALNASRVPRVHTCTANRAMPLNNCAPAKQDEAHARAIEPRFWATPRDRHGILDQLLRWHRLRFNRKSKPQNAAGATVVVAPFHGARLVPKGSAARRRSAGGTLSWASTNDETEHLPKNREDPVRGVTTGQGALRSPASQKLRFLLRQDRTVLYPPLVRSFFALRNSVHRGDAEGAEEDAEKTGERSPRMKRMDTDKTKGSGLICVHPLHLWQLFSFAFLCVFLCVLCVSAVNRWAVGRVAKWWVVR